MLSIISFLLVVVIALAWLRFGFWNGFLHMMCVLVAGALAFALWEPASMFLLGTDQGWLQDSAWGLGLALPFVAILLVIRIACDKIIPSNVHFDSLGNIIGGGVTGFISGTISVGILVISVNSFRVETDFMGYQPVQYESGQLVKKDGLLYPVDTLTAGFYSTLSGGSFLPSDGETLAKWRPQAAMMGPLQRVNFEDGASRNTVPPNAFEIVGKYTFTPEKDPKELLTDGADPNDPGARTRVQNVTYFDGEKANAGNSTIEGYVVRFKAGAKEKSGRIIVGPAQMQLLVLKDPNDPTSSTMIQPMAVVSQASGDKATLGRWRYDAQKVFISSASGRDDAPMAFEFLVPKGAKPLGLYVKGTRVDVSALTGDNYVGQAKRDAAIMSGQIVKPVDKSKLDFSSARDYKTNAAGGEMMITIRNQMPFNMVMQKDNTKGLEYNETNEVTGGGLAKFSANDLKNTQGMDPKLAVRRLYSPEDVVTLQVIVDRRNDVFGFLSDAASTADATRGPVLLDQNLTPYSAVGFGYKTKGETWVYFNPQAPVDSLTAHEMPTLSRSQPDQELVLIFRVSRNVKISHFAIGDKVLANFKPPVQTPAPGMK